MTERDFPSHIAIIMDGNRRWAAGQTGEGDGRLASIPGTGHHRGAETAEAIATAAFEAGVEWLTLFAFSTENWKRSPPELTALMTVFRHFLINRIDTLVERNLRLRVLGDTGGFAPDIAQGIAEAVARCADNDGPNLSIALGYGGRSDMAEATRRIARRVATGAIAPDAIDDAVIKAHLDTAELPPVDLLIRTGREKRISNFLLWDIAYAELAFTDTLWPDFTKDELLAIIGEYCGRNRRFGGDEAGIPWSRQSSGGGGR